METVYVASSNVGLGVFAARDLGQGAEILSFKGVPVDAMHPIHGTEEGANLLQVGVRTYLLLESPGVFVNHSCCPNAGLREAVRLVALRAILAGEEIRFDYSTSMNEDYWTMQCQCGEPGCRGVIRDFKYLPPETRQAYQALGIVAPFVLG